MQVCFDNDKAGITTLKELQRTTIPTLEFQDKSSNNSKNNNSKNWNENLKKPNRNKLRRKQI